MQTVRQFDQDHADIPGHRQQHLAEALRLALLAGTVGHPLQFADAIDHLGDIVAERRAQFFDGGRRVFEGVMQQTGGDGIGIEMQAGENPGNLDRMRDVGLAGKTRLPLMQTGGKSEGPADLVEAGSVIFAAKSVQNVVDPDHGENRGLGTRDCPRMGTVPLGAGG